MDLDPKSVLHTARQVLIIEERSIAKMRKRIGKEFVTAVEMLLACKGRVVFVGMGKSGLVCRKIAATFASTGTPSMFIHPAEGGHGDLGMLVRGDILVAVSNSGETEEMVRLLPAVKRLGLPIICMTGNGSSTLAKRADVTLDISVEEEACTLGLTPTASTTATLALGDSLAVALLELKGFSEEDFAMVHPWGTLGRRFLTVADIMHTGDEIPAVKDAAPLRDAILEITSKRLGFTTVVDSNRSLLGIITDGDLRRLLERQASPLDLTAGQAMTTAPKVITMDIMAAKALQIMESHSITGLVVVNSEGAIEGVIHLHDILKGGVA